MIDSTSPHPKKQWQRQLLRIIDPSQHFKYPKDPSDPNNGCSSVTIFAKHTDQLPTFARVGDIIRIHRANISLYKNAKSFCVNLSYGSSWVVFDGLVDLHKEIDTDDDDDSN